MATGEQDRPPRHLMKICAENQMIVQIALCASPFYFEGVLSVKYLEILL